MADEVDVTQEEPEVEQDVEAEVEPEAIPEKPKGKSYSEEEVTNINKTWEGRTKSAVRDALTAAGIGINEYGQYYSLNPTPSNNGQAEEEPYIDDDTKKYFDKRVTEAVNQQLGQVLPAVDMALESGLRLQYDDWEEVKTQVKTVLGSSGLTLAHAVRTPQLIDTLVNAERGKRLYAKEQETKKQADAERNRQRLLNSAGGVSSGGRVVSTGRLTAEDRELMAATGLNEQQYVDLVNGPAKVKVGGE
jgi:hypothetical protein